MLDKTYDASLIEPKIAKRWDEANAFSAGAGAKEGADPYCIVIPPPNVTGSLHMGHALNNTLQDVLVRWRRMLGDNVLWQPGMDHAGIATQMVVERQLAERNEPGRRELGREAFIERVWQWKDESGGIIFNQLKRLGASCDWDRERFTMDDGLSEAVLEVFVRLYDEGLIYRGKRLVNWDPKFETAISDLEVENRETEGHMWHFKYPLAGGETYEYVEKDEDGAVILREIRDYISIATTRPETMLGDGAVAVHPKDERYTPIVGKLCEIPVGPKAHRRQIPIITDEYPDPEFGSGAVKITGAHDFNDYAVAQRNGIPLYRLMDEQARMRADGDSYAEEAAKAMAFVRSGDMPDTATVDAINLVPDDLRGLDRYEARRRVVDAINAEGLAVMTVDAEGNAIPFVESKNIMQPFGDRSGEVIEPMLTDQWFADAKTLAGPAIESVREGRTSFVPKHWENTYFAWMENIEPWCISRQLWWGHRIPAWYGPDGQIFVRKTEEEALGAAVQHYLSHEGPWKAFVEEKLENFAAGDLLTRDEDVLDTWFSSALWPFSTLGWPEETKALKTWYPTNALVTGFDIIFFWVARMMMMGVHFMETEPFETVYVHALVRDKHGQKMSKSKGNVIDPLQLIDEYGADALRFTLAIMAAQGRDVKLDEQRIAGYRNFGTKLWNAVRFAGMNGAVHGGQFDPASAQHQINRWILTELSETIAEVDRALTDYRFNEAAGTLYRFVWNQLCDWYLELLKPIFNGEDEAGKAEARACLGYVLDQSFALLHPFMPFLTEELWSGTAERDGLLCHAAWPTGQVNDEAAASEINWLIEAISGIRSLRAEMNVPAGAKASLVIVGASEETRQRVLDHRNAIERLARIEAVSFEDVAPARSAQVVIGDATLCLPLGDLIDLEAESARLEKTLKTAKDDLQRSEKKLANEKFVSRADPEVVQAEREKAAELAQTAARLEQALSNLRG